MRTYRLTAFPALLRTWTLTWMRACMRECATLARLVYDTVIGTPPGMVLIGLGCMALVASNALPNWFALPRRTDPLVTSLVFVSVLVAFVCCIAGVRQHYPTWLARMLRWLAAPVLLWALFMSAQTLALLSGALVTTATQWPPRYNADEMYYNHYSALLTLRGENPYSGGDARMAQAMAYFHIQGYTPIARGHFSNPAHTPTSPELHAALNAYLAHPHSPPPEIAPATFHSYPAGAFLVNVPSVWAGLPSVGFAQLLLFLALVIALIALAPPQIRATLTLLLFCNPEAVRRIATGDFDIWWIALLAGVWLARDRRILASVLLGAACSIKQTAWFAAPFYFVWVWRAHGFAEAFRRAGIAVGAFLAINLPWMILSPREWFSSLFLPVSLPLLPDGSGAIGLAIAGVTPLLSSRVYAGAEIGLWLLALGWYWYAARRYPFACLALTLLPLLAAWRSPERYFLPLSLLALIALVATLRQPAFQEQAPVPPSPAADGVGAGAAPLRRLHATLMPPGRVAARPELPG